MSKMPMESRPLRLAPEVQLAVEEALDPLTGENLEKAQAAVLRLYQSGQQMTIGEWVTAYQNAIITALGGKRKAAA
jgi:hypothetical protein